MSLEEKLESAFDAGSGNMVPTDRDDDSSYDRVHFVVHPGWSQANYDKEWADPSRMDELLQEYYPEYTSNLGAVLEVAEHRNEAIHVIYSGDSKDYAENMIENITDDVNVLNYTESVLDSGDIKKRDIREIQETINQLSDSGEVILHGEIYERCVEGYGEALEDNFKEINDNISYGVTFKVDSIKI